MLGVSTVLVDAPNVATTIDGIYTWAQPFFASVWPFALIIIGIIVGVGLIGFLINTISNAFRH